jgi:hypothetical protein
MRRKKRQEGEGKVHPHMYTHREKERARGRDFYGCVRGECVCVLVCVFICREEEEKGNRTTNGLLITASLQPSTAPFSNWDGRRGRVCIIVYNNRR